MMSDDWRSDEEAQKLIDAIEGNAPPEGEGERMWVEKIGNRLTGYVSRKPPAVESPYYLIEVIPAAQAHEQIEQKDNALREIVALYEGKHDAATALAIARAALAPTPPKGADDE
jgi:hypothetical protein